MRRDHLIINIMYKELQKCIALRLTAITEDIRDTPVFVLGIGHIICITYMICLVRITIRSSYILGLNIGVTVYPGVTILIHERFRQRCLIFRYIDQTFRDIIVKHRTRICSVFCINDLILFKMIRRVIRVMIITADIQIFRCTVIPVLIHIYAIRKPCDRRCRNDGIPIFILEKCIDLDSYRFQLKHGISAELEIHTADPPGMDTASLPVIQIKVTIDMIP